MKVQAETYTTGFRPHSTRKEELPDKTPSFLLAVKGLTILNLQNVSPKTFLETWPSINNCFSPEKYPRNWERIKDQREADDVM